MSKNPFPTTSGRADRSSRPRANISASCRPARNRARPLARRSLWPTCSAACMARSRWRAGCATSRGPASARSQDRNRPPRISITTYGRDRAHPCRSCANNSITTGTGNGPMAMATLATKGFTRWTCAGGRAATSNSHRGLSRSADVSATTMMAKLLTPRSSFSIMSRCRLCSRCEACPTRPVPTG